MTNFRSRLHTLCACAVVFAVSHPLAAQWDRPPESGGRIFSIGQPKIFQWRAGLSSGAWLLGPGSSLMVRGEAGVSKAILSPDIGLLETGLEGFFGVRGTTLDGGARLLLQVPYLGLGAGAEFDALDAQFNFVVTARTPLRRGGIIAPGGLLRINWYPLAAHGFTVGISLPVRDPFAGRTRPIRDFVVVSNEFARPVPYAPPSAQLAAALDSLAVSAEWIRKLTVPFLDQDGRDNTIAEHRAGAYLTQLRARLAERGSVEEVRYFHAQLEHAFALATGNATLAKPLAALARRTLLDEVLLPYNSLLGQQKRSDELVELGIIARGRFSHAFVAEGLARGIATDPVLFVFQRLTEMMEVERARAAKEWDDPRLVWLPLQYALLPEDHDSQEELDALVERITHAQFSNQNQVRYLANLQFRWELLRTIDETVNYHVLWVHDFASVTKSGRLDSMAIQIVEGYLGALAKRLTTYDATGKLPAFFIFLDEHYYEGRGSRLWMTLLEDPLHASSAIAQATPEERRRIATALDAVRSAAAGSTLLQAERRQYGDAWLTNRVKVHVNITNRADPSFWGGGLVSSVFGYPDNVMRDHRKIVFRDVSDADPFAGVGIYTGSGVGEQYTGPTWDERSVMVRGPALIELRNAARDLLVSQGVAEQDVPLVLRSQPRPADWEKQVAAGNRDSGFTSRAVQLMNGTGYLAKRLNAGKAVLYSLMPPESVIKIPDSLWNSFFYTGLLLGACLRGADVTIVAPAADNAPSKGPTQLAREWELMSRLLMARDSLAEPLGAAGGMLGLELYALPADEHGLASRAATWIANVRETTSFKQLMPFFDALRPVVADQAAHSGVSIVGAPKLHQKVQFLATGPFWKAIVSAPEWPEFMRTYLEYREATYSVVNLARDAERLPAKLGEIASRMYARVRDVPGAASYAFVGSQNQDNRGMFMDGEVALLFSGPNALVPLVDLAFLQGTSTWLRTRQDLERLLRAPSELMRRLGRVTKDAM